MTELPGSSKAARLRSEFDQAFTLPHATEAPAQLDLLLIRVGGDAYAMPLSQVVALHVDRALTQAPSARPDLLGLVGLRGVVTPVYDLNALLGYPTRSTARFLVQVVAASPFALAFEHFERHQRVAAAALTPLARAAGAAGALGSVTLGDGQFTVLDLQAIFEHSGRGRRAHAPKQSQERQ